MRIEPEVRTAAHYRRLLEINPHASIGWRMATDSVFAARFGACASCDRVEDAWFRIAQDLTSRYGDHLEADAVLEEMRRESVFTHAPKSAVAPADMPTPPDPAAAPTSAAGFHGAPPGAPIAVFLPIHASAAASADRPTDAAPAANAPAAGVCGSAPPGAPGDGVARAMAV